jgi:organic hydroperoxide reductase OsmC/OhrA
MQISAHLQNSANQHHITIQTNDQTHSLNIPPKATGFGSSANGGELLFLALATCYCNDIYREAAKRGIKVEKVEIEVQGNFGSEGVPAQHVTYQAKVTARAAEADIRELMKHTDEVAEIQNTLRVGTPVALTALEVVTV